MAIMYITEFADVAKTGGTIAMAAIPAVAKQFISFTGTAGTSAALQNNTKVVRIELDTAGSVAFGTAPTAVTAQDMRMAAGAAEYFDLSNVVGQAYKVSAVTTT